MKKRQVYLDNASTTPLNKKVFLAMTPYLKDEYGNPASLHSKGREAKNAISKAKTEISLALRCQPTEIYFTASATESDNLALAGFARANRGYGNRIIVSAVEHKGIFSICEKLKKEGFEIVEIPVDENGVVSLADLKKELNDKTILVSVTMADSETGTIQSVKEISKIIRNFRASRVFPLAPNSQPLTPVFHTDASQALGHIDCDSQKLGADMMTISAHKIGGPKGVGALFVKRGIKLEPVIFGGGQQGSIRSGTENVTGIVGFGEAVRLAEKNKKKESVRLGKLRDKLQKGIFKLISKVVLNGHPTERLPNILNVSFLDIEGEALLLYLDNAGIMVSTGSACNSDSLEPSQILKAMGKPYEFIHGSIRFSLGDETSAGDIDYVLKELPKFVKILRSVSPLDVNANQNKEMSEPKAFVGGQKPHFLKSRD